MPLFGVPRRRATPRYSLRRSKPFSANGVTGTVPGRAPALLSGCVAAVSAESARVIAPPAASALLVSYLPLSANRYTAAMPATYQFLGRGAVRARVLLPHFDMTGVNRRHSPGASPARGAGTGVPGNFLLYQRGKSRQGRRYRLPGTRRC